MNKILFGFAMLVSSFAMATPSHNVGQMVDGSYAGTVYVKDAQGNQVNQWGEVLAITDLGNNTSTATFNITYTDGTKETEVMTLTYSDATHFAIAHNGANIGQGSWTNMVMSYSYLNGQYHGTMDFSVAGQMTRTEIQPSHSGLLTVSAVMIKQ